MLLNIGIILLIVSGSLMFQQNDYNVTFELLEIPYNRIGVVSYGKTVNFKYNRTCTLVNITLHIDIDINHKLEVVYQAYKMASNEYRLFPLRYMDNFCVAMARNDYGFKEFQRRGNFTCPPKKGIYTICNWAPNGTQFPPHVPNGSYKVELLFYYGNVQVLTMEVYGTISRPIV